MCAILSTSREYSHHESLSFFTARLHVGHRERLLQRHFACENDLTQIRIPRFISRRLIEHESDNSLNILLHSTRTNFNHYFLRSAALYTAELATLLIEPLFESASNDGLSTPMLFCPFSSANFGSFLGTGLVLWQLPKKLQILKCDFLDEKSWKL